MMKPTMWRKMLTLQLAGMNVRMANKLPERFVSKIKHAAATLTSSEQNILQLVADLRHTHHVQQLDPSRGVAGVLESDSIVAVWEESLRKRAEQVRVLRWAERSGSFVT